MESINPKDFSEIDLFNIEYVTLKNGNMILLDITVPEKKNKSKTIKNQNNSISNYIDLSISRPIVVSYKSSLKTKLTNKERNNNSIVKNDNLFFQNNKKNNFNIKYDKNDLNDLRNKIDEIDKKIVESFIERMKIIKYISKYKKEKKLPIFDPLRENELLNKRKEMANDISLNNDIEKLFKLILTISKEHQINSNNNNLKFNDNFLNNEISKITIKQNEFQIKKSENKPILKNKLNLNNINNNIIINDIPKNESLNCFNSKNNNLLNNPNENIIERRNKRLNTFLDKNKKKEKNKKGRNNSSINSACSFNIPSNYPKNVNIIKKFNNLVDKLNDQKYKTYRKRKELKEEQNKINKKYYKIYKNINNNKISNNDYNNNNNKKIIRRNIFNICGNFEFNSLSKDSITKKIINNKTNIFNLKKNNTNIDELKTNRTCRNNSNKLFKYKINSTIVLPSNNYY